VKAAKKLDWLCRSFDTYIYRAVAPPSSPENLARGLFNPIFYCPGPIGLWVFWRLNLTRSRRNLIYTYMFSRKCLKAIFLLQSYLLKKQFCILVVYWNSRSKFTKQRTHTALLSCYMILTVATQLFSDEDLCCELQPSPRPPSLSPPPLLQPEGLEIGQGGQVPSPPPPFATLPLL
jgi:hypothetical protein